MTTVFGSLSVITVKLSKMVEEEKGIITEEVKMYEDEIETKLIFKSFENMLHKDKTKNKISGSEEDVKSIELEDLENAYKTFYHPSNMNYIPTYKTFLNFTCSSKHSIS